MLMRWLKSLLFQEPKRNVYFWGLLFGVLGLVFVWFLKLEDPYVRYINPIVTVFFVVWCVQLKQMVPVERVERQVSASLTLIFSCKYLYYLFSPDLKSSWLEVGDAFWNLTFQMVIFYVIFNSRTGFILAMSLATFTLLTGSIRFSGLLNSGLLPNPSPELFAWFVRAEINMFCMGMLLHVMASLKDRLITLGRRLEHSQRLAVEAEERTRREISEFLHGRVQTGLLLAWNQLSDYPDLRDEPSRVALVKNVCDELERIRETDVRQASHALHPSVITMGLISAVRSLASRMTEVLPIQIEVTPEFAALDEAANSPLQEDVRLVAYRVIEEAIGNTLRHAKAKRVTVRFARASSDAFEVCIHDDGQGFESTTSPFGLGFASIDARVHALQGTWSIHSQIGGPTELIVRLPLGPNQAQATAQRPLQTAHGSSRII
jgi:signal transduction histidine kinase